RVRVLIESGRQEHMGAEVHRCSIELSEQVALDTNMLDVLGVFRWLDRWNHLVELDSDDVGAVRVDFDSLRRAVEIARFAVPLLTLTPVGRQLDGVTGREIEGLVSVQYRLRPVFPGRQLSRRVEREAVGIRQDDGAARRPAFDIHAEARLTSG